jgi:proton glutamate symport protein
VWKNPGVSMKRIKLHWQILIALLLAVGAGAVLGEKALLFEPLGTLFLKALNMIIVPLIVTSIVSGIANIGGAENIGRLGLKTFCYYVTTSLFAILVGLALVNLIGPGVGADLGLKAPTEDLARTMQEHYSGSPWATILGIVMRMVPTNPVRAMVEGEMLQIIVFCILFGYFITRVPDPYRAQMTGLFEAGFQIMMKLTHFIILFAPIGVFGLVAKMVATSGVGVFRDLGVYALTVVAGLLVHACITLPALLVLVGRRVSPVKHLKAMASALLTAFSTSSSSATLPLTMESVEKNAGVSNKISSFVLPLGATINMDGTALYECVAAMFIAQAYGIDLGLGQQMIVVITALLVSIGAAGIPMAGLVMMVVILKAVGLPLEGVGLILAVDRILDMCRTTVNVWSDSCGAVVIARTEGETLHV